MKYTLYIIAIICVLNTPILEAKKKVNPKRVIEHISQEDHARLFVHDVRNSLKEVDRSCQEHQLLFSQVGISEYRAFQIWCEKWDAFHKELSQLSDEDYHIETCLLLDQIAEFLALLATTSPINESL